MISERWFGCPCVNSTHYNRDTLIYCKSVTTLNAEADGDRVMWDECQISEPYFMICHWRWFLCLNSTESWMKEWTKNQFIRWSSEINTAIVFGCLKQPCNILLWANQHFEFASLHSQLKWNYYIQTCMLIRIYRNFFVLEIVANSMITLRTEWDTRMSYELGQTVKQQSLLKI